MKRKFVVLGASSPVGRHILDILHARGEEVFAITRGTPPMENGQIQWRSVSQLDSLAGADIRWAVCVAHVWVVSQYLERLKAAGVRRLAVLSTTSLFTKRASSSAEETAAAALFASAEADVIQNCERLGLDVVILRPTLIYGDGKDKNVAEIARMIRRFGFFPMFGTGQGKRQPIHARDVSKAAISAVLSEQTSGKTYNISGGEILPYNEMVRRIFRAMDRRPVMPIIPLWAFRAALAALRVIPRFRNWTPDMAIRMNSDQAFDHTDAAKDFGFAPQPFELTARDVS